MTRDAVSLGELAVRYGLILESDRAQLSRELEATARAGRATSMAHRLLQRGVPRGTLESVLGAGDPAAPVACDACGHPTPGPRFQARQALPCERCGVLLVGFAPFAPGSSASEEAGSRTIGFPDVLVPSVSPSPQALTDAETTAEFDLLTTPEPGGPFDSLQTPALQPTIELPPGSPPSPAEPPRSPALADLPGLETLDPAAALEQMVQRRESAPHVPTPSTRRRRPARTTGVMAVPAPPALWPWIAAIVVLTTLCAAEVVAHLLL